MHKTLIALSLGAALGGPALAGDTAPSADEARQAAMSLGKQLKATLGKAMKSGGPTQAINVCNIKAPEIASDVSADTGWKVARTSLKLRNPNNAPDAWETAVLKDFEQRKAAGESPETLEYSEVVEQDGRRVFRFMKAIPTQKVCTNCHGGDGVSEEVVAKLKTLYPEDQARGFKEGDLRGAFTLSKPL